MTPPGIRGFWQLLNLPCEGMSRLASESLDRSLGPVEKLALRSHQAYCRSCRRHGKQLDFLRLASGELRHGILIEAETVHGHESRLPGLPDGDRVRIKKALREGDAGLDASPPFAPSSPHDHDS